MLTPPNQSVLKEFARFSYGGGNDQAASVMSSEAMVSFLRKVAPGVEQSLQQNETVDIFQVSLSRYHQACV